MQGQSTELYRTGFLDPAGGSKSWGVLLRYIFLVRLPLFLVTRLLYDNETRLRVGSFLFGRKVMEEAVFGQYVEMVVEGKEGMSAWCDAEAFQGLVDAGDDVDAVRVVFHRHGPGAFEFLRLPDEGDAFPRVLSRYRGTGKSGYARAAMREPNGADQALGSMVFRLEAEGFVVDHWASEDAWLSPWPPEPAPRDGGA